MPLPCVPGPMKGRFSVRLRTALFAGASALALASLPVAANASVVHPLTVQPLVCTGGYTFDLLQDNSTAIKVEFIPQCSGEAAGVSQHLGMGPDFQRRPVHPLHGDVGPEQRRRPDIRLPRNRARHLPGHRHHGGTSKRRFVSDDCGTTTEP